MNKPLTHELTRELWTGSPHPLGATWDGQGVNFALYSRHADKVELCLFDETGRRELQRIPLRERTDFVWHGYVPTLKPGQLYGYRVHGPYRPEEGHRFNPHKLLIDPYARALAGAIKWSDAHFGYTIGHKREDLSLDRRDSAPFMPKSQVVDNAFDWSGDHRPHVAGNERAVYELHVGGYTRRHPDVPPAAQGKFAGLAVRQVLDHIASLGVTTVEILPVHAFVDDRALTQRGLVNYWGYNTIGYFAPDPRYGVANPVHEFKAMVKALHAAGVEVILDVVYNHTGEGNEKGPTLSFRGVDNHDYYRLAEDKRFCPLRPVLPRAAPGSGALAAGADRRALGPGRRRLPARAFPAGLGGVERPVPRHDARLLERRWRADRRFRAPAHGLERLLREERPRAGRERELHRRPRRLHAARPRLLQRQAQRGQRRGEPRWRLQ